MKKPMMKILTSVLLILCLVNPGHAASEKPVRDIVDAFDMIIQESDRDWQYDEIVVRVVGDGILALSPEQKIVLIDKVIREMDTKSSRKMRKAVLMGLFIGAMGKVKPEAMSLPKKNLIMKSAMIAAIGGVAGYAWESGDYSAAQKIIESLQELKQSYQHEIALRDL